MTFISATYTPADKHLKSTYDKYSRAQYVRSDVAGTIGPFERRFRTDRAVR
jgi:hypothetical protein